MPTPTIVTESLVKRFGQHRALDGVDLEVPRGHILGLLGPNGAGKTTTVVDVLGRSSSGEWLAPSTATVLAPIRRPIAS